jgi:fructose-1,6-bisphosphatase/inositol monophosphatase family enzyme
MLVPFKFSAIRGKGAFFNGSQIKASSQDELVKAFLVTEPSGSYIRRELTVFAVVPAQPAATKEVSGLFIVPSRVAMTRSVPHTVSHVPAATV